MPRSGTGTYTLPSGNPVVTGTTIDSTWANTTLSDIGTTLSDSLSRSGQGGMTAALRLADGTQGAPGVAFANETSTGFYRAGTGEMWAVVQGAQTLNLDASGVYVPADKTTTVDGAFVFNEAGADKDARFEGDTDANLLFIDASTDRVGIGTNTPVAKLDVNLVGNARLLIGSSGTSENYYDANTQFWRNGAGSTERMRLDSFGNLLLGTTSTGADGLGISNLLNLTFPEGSGTSYTNLFRQASSGATVIANGYKRSATASGFASSVGTSWAKTAIGLGVGTGAITFYTDSAGTVANGTDVTPSERARITSGGDLAVGNTAAYNNSIISSYPGTSRNGLGVSVDSTVAGTYTGVYINRTASDGPYLVFDRGATRIGTIDVSGTSLVVTTNNLERARITSAGDLLVGDTNGGLQNSYSTNFTQASGYWAVNHANGSPDTRRYFYFGYNGAEIGSITQNGTTGVLFNQTSDRRLKDNIVPAPSASDVIDAIQIVSHDWKAAPDEHVTYGVIAQDLALVAPQAVAVGDDGDAVETPWGVDYSKLVPMLIKEIQSLRARVAALEAA